MLSSDLEKDIIQSKYVASAVKKEQYPPDELAEAAFIGRSNVGKSSLLNSLCRRHGLARTSSTPGKTQTLNFYQVTFKRNERRDELYLVDLPGYGYAKTGRANRERWSKFIEDYLLHSPRLKLVCQLIDIRHAPMESDITTFKWLTKNNIPVQVVVTKADKISRMAQTKQVSIIKNSLGLSKGEIVIYSSESGMGRADLLDVIDQFLLK